MNEEDIKKVDEWVENHEDDNTYYYEDEYVIGASDVKEFCNFLREGYPDLGIPCIVNGGGIWFRRSDLEDARS